jgi:hypothetical protein
MFAVAEVRVEILFSTKLPVSASSFDESDFSAGAAEDDGGEFIGFLRN